MKKIIYFLLCSISVPFFSSNVQAQCNVGSPLIEITNKQTVGSNCQITFNFSYTSDQNNGADRTYIHLWTSGSYPSPACSYSSVPTTCLNNTIANIIIDNNAADVANPINANVFLNTYTPYPTIDPKVLDETEGLTFQKVVLNSQYSRYKIYGITLTVPGACNSFITLKSDIWSTQANNSKPHVHCTDTNFDLLTVDPTISGNIQCAPNANNLTNTYNFSITTSSTNTLYFDAKVYYDNGNGLYDLYLDTPLITTLTNLRVVSGSPYNSGTISYTSPDTTRKKQNLIVVLSNLRTSTQTFESITSQMIVNPCAMIALPIDLYQFSGRRDQQKVQLSWTTRAQKELFSNEVQKMVNGKWQTISTVHDRNNETINTYTFSENNTDAEPSFYRLALKGSISATSYSKVVKINAYNRGYQKEVKVVPNPAKVNGKTMISIESAIDCKVLIYDLQGRIVHQWKHVGTASQEVVFVNTGIYFLKAISTDGAVVDYQKIVVY